MNLQAVAGIRSGQWVANYITICTGRQTELVNVNPVNRTGSPQDKTETQRQRQRKTELVNDNPVNRTGSPQDKTNRQTETETERQRKS